MDNSNPEVREKRFLIRAGLFVVLGLGLAAVVILLIGKERRFFDREHTYRASFDDVDGLKLDSPVRLGGLEVGRVSGIEFAPQVGDKRIIVSLKVSSKFSERIRGDTVARIGSRGVLGDKAVDLSLGSPSTPVVPEGGDLKSGTSGDVASLLKTAGEIVDNVKRISTEVQGAVTAYADPEIQKDLSGLLRGAHHVMNEIESGGGALHALVYDPKTARDVQGLLASAARATGKVDAAMGEAQALLSQARQGDGLVHSLLYDKRGDQLLRDLSGAANELSGLVADAKKTKNGAVHQLVYGDSKDLFADLGAAANNLKAITHKVASGEGSLGGLINDPTLYEDLIEVLGNVKRNRVLRALVRYSISNGEDLDKPGQSVAPAAP